MSTSKVQHCKKILACHILPTLLSENQLPPLSISHSQRILYMRYYKLISPASSNWKSLQIAWAWRRTLPRFPVPSSKQRSEAVAVRYHSFPVPRRSGSRPFIHALSRPEREVAIPWNKRRGQSWGFCTDRLPTEVPHPLSDQKWQIVKPTGCSLYRQLYHKKSQS